MPLNTRTTAIALAIMLLLTVASQLLYTTMLGGVGLVEGWPLRSVIWTAELLLFGGITVGALVALVRSTDLHWGWSALAVAGLINMIQSGMGLSMFMPATLAGAEFAPMMKMVLAGSFLFYNLAKAILGVAAFLFGLVLFRNGDRTKRAGGLLAMVAGVAGMALNIAAVHLGLGSVPVAGASGAIATFFVAVSLLLLARGVTRQNT